MLGIITKFPLYYTLFLMFPILFFLSNASCTLILSMCLLTILTVLTNLGTTNKTLTCDISFFFFQKYISLVKSTHHQPVPFAWIFYLTRFLPHPNRHLHPSHRYHYDSYHFVTGNFSESSSSNTIFKSSSLSLSSEIESGTNFSSVSVLWWPLMGLLSSDSK